MKSDDLLPKPGRYTKARFYAAPCLLICIIITAILLNTGIIPPKNLYLALLLPSLLELFLIILVIINISFIIKNYRILKGHGYHNAEAWQGALAVISSPRLARLATLEPQLYYALYRSYRRKKAVPPSFGSRRDSYAFLIKVFIFLCLLEVIMVTILLPQHWLVWKLVHMILGLWAVLFMWSDYRAIGIYRHGIGQKGIRLRLGLRCSLQLSWDDIAGVRRISESAPSGLLGPGVPKNRPGDFYIGLGDASNLEITLHKPQSIQAMVNEVPGISRLLLSLEDPDAFMTALRVYQPDLPYTG